jgi:uncharacterized membrane protein YdjX (TVP38/TMEM64 family)
MRRRILGFGALAALLLVAWKMGFFERLDPGHLRELVASAGPWAPVLYFVLFSCFEAVGVPGVVFIGAAVAIWPLWTAFALIWAGSVGAGCVGFLFARTIGRDFVTAHMPERLRRFDARLASSGLRWVIGLRLLTYLAAPAHWLIGLSGVPFRTALLGSIIGFGPWAFVWALMGHAVVTWLFDKPAELWLGLGALIALAFALHRLYQRNRTSPSADGGV